MLLGNGATNELKMFILNDPSIISGLKIIFNISSVPDKMILVDSREKILESLKSDPYALALCDYRESLILQQINSTKTSLLSLSIKIPMGRSIIWRIYTRMQAPLPVECGLENTRKH
jgi:hypothetical protein